MAGKRFTVSRNPFTGIKRYCETSKSNNRDNELLEERRKAAARWNEMIADPTISLSKRGLIKKPAISAPI